ncbi:MAG: ATP-binding protein [Chloroflexota bacterium]
MSGAILAIQGRSARRNWAGSGMATLTRRDDRRQTSAKTTPMPPAPAPAPSDLRVRLLGQFAIEGPDGPIPHAQIGSRKARTLLKMLVLDRGHLVSIDRIATALWSDPPDNAGRLVATLVSRLRGVLGRDAIQGTQDGYRFVPSPARQIDLDAAERLTTEAELRLRRNEPALARVAAAGAIDLLAAGTVLEDEPYVEWAQPARSDCDRLRRRARAALWTAAFEAGDAEEALAAAEAAIATDPLDEEAHRAAMLANHRSGRRNQALLAYERLRRCLADELGVAPAPETRELHRAIVQEQRPSADRVVDRGRERTSGSDAPDPRFVGREAELATLRAAWTQAVDGRGGLFLLIGEAGIGKTALAARLEAVARSTGGLVLRARCYEAERSLFLEPFADAIRPVVLASPVELAQDLAPEQAAALIELVPELQDLLRSPRVPPASAEVERRRALEACVALLKGVTRRRPVLLVLDDVHNAGATTIELLHFAARRLATHRLLMVGTVRPEEGEAQLDQLDDVARRVSLDTLPAEAIAQLARGSGLTRLAKRIHALSGGHPLYAIELIRALSDQAGASGEALPMPESLREAVTGRSRRAGDDVDEFLRAAAVLGSAFDLATVADLIGIELEDVVRRADRARRARLVVESGNQLAFANDLIREIMYQTTPPAIRGARHLRAMTLVAANPEAVAGHAAAAGQWADAAGRWLDAASRAAGRFSNRDAKHLLGKALNAARRGGDDTLQIRILLSRADVGEALADYGGAFEDQSVAVDLARRAGDRALEVQSLLRLGGDVAIGLGRPTETSVAYLEQGLSLARELGDTSATVHILARLSILATNRLRSDLAELYAAEAVEAARPSGDEELLATALDALKTCHAYVGDIERLEEVLGELEPKLRRAELPRLLQWTVFESSIPAMARGQWDLASERIEEALRLNERTGYGAYAAFFLAHVAWIARARGEPGAALEAGRRSTELAAKVGHPWWTAFTNGIIGWTLTELGEVDEAIRCLETGLAAAERDGSAAYLVRCLGPLALARSLAGDDEESLALAERASTILQQAQSAGGRMYLHAAHVQIAIARVWLRADQPERAQQLLAPVSKAAETAGWAEFAASASLELAHAKLARASRR